MNRFLDYLVEIAIACDREDCSRPGEVLLTAGGSTFYDLVAQRFQAVGIQRPFKVLTAQRLLSYPRLRRIHRSLCAASQAHALGGRSGSGARRRARSVGLRPVAAGAKEGDPDCRQAGHLLRFPPAAAVEMAAALAERDGVRHSSRSVPVTRLPASTTSIAIWRCPWRARSPSATWWPSASLIPAPHSTNGR